MESSQTHWAQVDWLKVHRAWGGCMERGEGREGGGKEGGE